MKKISIIFYFLCFCLLSSVRAAQTVPNPLIREVERLLGLYSEPCAFLLEDLSIRDAAYDAALMMLKKNKAEFQFIEDRLIVHFATEGTDPRFQDLSMVGVSNLKRILRTKLSTGGLMSAIYGAKAKKVPDTHSEPLVEHATVVLRMLRARETGDWNEVIRIFSMELNPNLRRMSDLRRQFAYALLNRNTDFDRNHAEYLLKWLRISSHATASDLGLLAKLSKERFEELRTRGKSFDGRDKYLNLAIDAYTEAFDLEPRELKWGINAIELLLLKHTPEAIKSIRLLASPVKSLFKLKLNEDPDDYFAISAALRMAIFERDWNEAHWLLLSLLEADAVCWMYESTQSSLNLVLNTWTKILETHSSDSGVLLPSDIKELSAIVSAINQKINYFMANPPTLAFTDIIPAPLKSKSLVPQQIHPSITQEQIKMIHRYSRGILTTPTFMLRYLDFKDGYLLGLMEPYQYVIYRSVAEVFNLNNYFQAYTRMGLLTERDEDVEKFIENITSQDKPIVFLLPDARMKTTEDHFEHSEKEFQLLFQNPEYRLRNVYFVTDAYQMLQKNFVREAINESEKLELSKVYEAILKRLKK